MSVPLSFSQRGDRPEPSTAGNDALQSLHFHRPEITPPDSRSDFPRNIKMSSYAGPPELRDGILKVARRSLSENFQRTNLRILVAPFRHSSRDSHVAEQSNGRVLGQQLSEIETLVAELSARYYGFATKGIQGLGKLSLDELWTRLEAVGKGDSRVSACYLPGEDRIQLDAYSVTIHLLDPLRAFDRRVPDLGRILLHEAVHFEFGDLNYRIEQRLNANRSAPELEGIPKAAATGLSGSRLVEIEKLISGALHITVLEDALAYAFCGSLDYFGTHVLFPNMLGRYLARGDGPENSFAPHLLQRIIDDTDSCRTWGTRMFADKKYLEEYVLLERAAGRIGTMLSAWGELETLNFMKRILSQAWHERRSALSFLLPDEYERHQTLSTREPHIEVA